MGPRADLHARSRREPPEEAGKVVVVIADDERTPMATDFHA